MGGCCDMKNIMNTFTLRDDDVHVNRTLVGRKHQAQQRDLLFVHHNIFVTYSITNRLIQSSLKFVLSTCHQDYILKHWTIGHWIARSWQLRS